jgi:hypothetical protein
MRGNLRVSSGVKPAFFLSVCLLGVFPAPAQENGGNFPVRAARWYRSNAGGMTLEEVPTRVVALHNEYALLIDYARPADMPPMLRSFYRDGYTIEFHALYTGGKESRRQWIFRDAQRVARLVSVLNQDREAPPPPREPSSGENNDAEAAPGSDPPTGRAPWGFIEIYNEDYRIIEEYMFSDDGEETIIVYAYRGGLLVKAEGRRKMADGPEEGVKTFTDDYRYNRSASLRSVERLYHEEIEAVPVRLAFSNRILDAAKEKDFIGEKLASDSAFFGSFDVKPGYRIVYTTDERGRILTQSLLDSEDNTVWIIQNTWTGNRIASSLKTGDGDEQLIEYEYNDRGDRIVERNVHNGILERMVRAEGGREVEELYMNGEIVLRAIWEDGRKISEERIRRSR